VALRKVYQYPESVWCPGLRLIDRAFIARIRSRAPSGAWRQAFYNDMRSPSDAETDPVRSFTGFWMIRRRTDPDSGPFWRSLFTR
jgi:hypothetical protein